MAKPGSTGPSWREYLLALLSVSEGYWGVIGFGFLILTLILSPLSDVVPEHPEWFTPLLERLISVLTGVLAFICLFAASFSLYKKALEEWPSSGLKIELGEPSIAVDELGAILSQYSRAGRLEELEIAYVQFRASVFVVNEPPQPHPCSDR